MSDRRRGKSPAEEKHRYLSHTAVFADLAQGELDELVPLVTIRRYRKDRIFFMPLEQIGFVFFLFEGRVHLSRLTDCGKKLVVARLEPGSLFGEKALFYGGDPSLFAEAITDCVVGVMQRHVFQNLMCQQPMVAVRLAETVTVRLAQLENSLVKMAFKPVPARLAYVLLSSAQENGAGEEVRGYTHRDLSDMLGTYRETVTEALGEFKAQGLIATGRKRITLLDRRGLEDLASR